MKNTIIITLLILLCNNTYAQSIATFNNHLTYNNQVLYVKTNSVESIQGTMMLYERKNNRKSWKIKDSFAVVVGRTGIAKDRQTSLSFDANMPVKKEGDGKSPAGIFSLGDVFSYHSLHGLHTSFVQVDTNFYCVDDVASSYYNTLIVKDTAKAIFNSFEYMKRNDSLYEYGVWVLYNSDPVTVGNGSCIFLHVWRNDHSGTAGCTAMAKENMLKLIYWLDRKKKPVLLQIVNQDNR